MELVSPSAEYKASFIEAVKEFQADDDYSYRNQSYKKLSVDELENNFDAYVERELSHAKGENLPEGYIPSSEYWLIDNGEYIGRTSIRHRLTEKLKIIGGHIGYDIRPSKRGHGYGNEVLRLALQKAKEMGIVRALLTCDIRNEASRKIIEKNGGVLENQVPNPEAGHDMLRFWIDLAA